MLTRRMRKKYEVGRRDEFETDILAANSGPNADVSGQNLALMLTRKTNEIEAQCYSLHYAAISIAGTVKK